MHNYVHVYAHCIWLNDAKTNVMSGCKRQLCKMHSISGTLRNILYPQFNIHGHVALRLTFVLCFYRITSVENTGVLVLCDD